MPSVSIIIPAFNRAKLIGETLESVRAQTYLDWECLVVDDGSTDDTPCVVQEFAARDPRFRSLPKENAGRSAAWRCGLDRASGEFVAFLDSDDVWLPDFLAAATQMLRQHPRAALAAAPRHNWNGSQVTGTLPFTPQQIASPLREMIRHDFLVPSQCLLRSAALSHVKQFRFWPSDDLDLWLQILPGRGAVLGGEPLVKYRRHDGNEYRDGDLSRRSFLASLHIQILGAFTRRRGISLACRVLALGNMERKHEQLLQFAMEEGRVPPSRLARWGRLLRIVPSPLLRNPRLARRYLTYAAPAENAAP